MLLLWMLDRGSFAMARGTFYIKKY